MESVCQGLTGTIAEWTQGNNCTYINMHAVPKVCKKIYGIYGVYKRVKLRAHINGPWFSSLTLGSSTQTLVKAGITAAPQQVLLQYSASIHAADQCGGLKGHSPGRVRQSPGSLALDWTWKTLCWQNRIFPGVELQVCGLECTL